MRGLNPRIPLSNPTNARRQALSPFRTVTALVAVGAPLRPAMLLRTSLLGALLRLGPALLGRPGRTIRHFGGGDHAAVGMPRMIVDDRDADLDQLLDVLQEGPLLA